MRKIPFIFLIILSTISCKKEKIETPPDENTPVWLDFRIIKAEGATSGSIKQTIPISITWLAGACDIADKFSESKNGSTIDIKLFGKSPNSICVNSMKEGKATYNFLATEPGRYELKFKSGDSFIIHDITIN